MFLPQKRADAELRLALSALACVPLFEGVSPGLFVIERLGSLTNVSFKVTFDGEAYALRLPGEGTSEYIDRAAEEHSSRIAASAGVGPEVVFFDRRDGTMLCRFMEGVAMTPERFGEDRSAPARAALALKRVHSFGETFEARFDVFEIFDRYLELLRVLQVPLPESFRTLVQEALAVRQALESSPTHLVPSHNDPWPSNFVDTGEKMCLLDWEYSGMNDRMWDLADLSVEAGFTPEQDRSMMRAYFGKPQAALYSRLALYKAMSDLLWALWAMVQHAGGNPQDDFLSYALKRLGRCEARMSEPVFESHLYAVTAERRRRRSQEKRLLIRHARVAHEIPDSAPDQAEPSPATTA